MTWVERRTLDLPLEDLPFNANENVDVFDFSTLRVMLPDKRSAHDLGALCYAERKRKGNHPFQNDFTVWLVKPTSLRIERKRGIGRFAEYLFTLHSLGKRSKTILNHLTVFIGFVQWCDSNCDDVFSSQLDARRAYYLYTHFLLDEVRKNKLHINSAVLKQRKTAVILSAIFEVEDGSLTAGINNIRFNKAAANVTEPPSEETAQRAIDLYTHLFTGLSKFLVDFDKYPFQLKLPSETVWVFPGKLAFAIKRTLTKRKEWKSGYWAWNYDEGCIAEFDAIHHHYSDAYSANYCIENANDLIQVANRDPLYHSRYALASLAIQCFIMLFVANTAMNVGPLSQLSWDAHNTFDIDKDENQRFRTIKHRAGNRYVEFHITSNFLPFFRQYLKLRSMVLDNKEAPLFFILDMQGNPKKVDSSLLVYLRRKLHKFELTVPTAREWRAYKSDWMIRSTDVATTALLLQNSERTVVKSYVAGSKIRADQEMTEFLSILHQKIIKTDTIQTVAISIGQCKEYNTPTPDQMGQFIQPDCRQPEGCLFCSNYRVHADEEDIRKLCSCQYVISETRSLALSESHFNDVFGEVLQRVAYLLQQIGVMNDSLKNKISQIQKEVEVDEKLSPYWASKLHMLVELEVI